MNLVLNVNATSVEDPFAATPRHGADVPWVVRDLSDRGRLIEDEELTYRMSPLGPSLFD